MTLRIGCDLDGTLADMAAALHVEAERLLGTGVDLRIGVAVPPEPPAEPELPDIADTAADSSSSHAQTEPVVRRGVTSREYRQLWAHVGRIENFWSTLNEIEPGAVARLSRAASRHGWEIIFLTKRPPSAGDTAQRQSQRWLVAHGFELPSVFVVGGSRGLIAAAMNLDVVIDDRPENCLDVATDSEAKSFLVWRESPDTAPQAAGRMRIETMFSFGEALDRLEALSPANRGASRLMARIRQSLRI